MSERVYRLRDRWITNYEYCNASAVCLSTQPHLQWSPSADGDIEARGASYAPRISIASSRIVLFTLRERSATIEKFAGCNRYVNHARVRSVSEDVNVESFRFIPLSFTGFRWKYHRSPFTQFVLDEGNCILSLCRNI